MSKSTLTADFAAASEADWRALVDKTLGETPFESLARRKPGQPVRESARAR